LAQHTFTFINLQWARRASNPQRHCLQVRVEYTTTTRRDGTQHARRLKSQRTDLWDIRLGMHPVASPGFVARRAKLEIRSWGTHGELPGRPGAAATWWIIVLWLIQYWLIERAVSCWQMQSIQVLRSVWD